MPKTETDKQIVTHRIEKMLNALGEPCVFHEDGLNTQSYITVSLKEGALDTKIDEGNGRTKYKVHFSDLDINVTIKRHK